MATTHTWQVFTIGLNVLTIDGLHHGFATHMIRLKLNDITKFAKVLNSPTMYLDELLTTTLG